MLVTKRKRDLANELVNLIGENSLKLKSSLKGVTNPVIEEQLKAREAIFSNSLRRMQDILRNPKWVEKYPGLQLMVVRDKDIDLVGGFAVYDCEVGVVTGYLDKSFNSESLSLFPLTPINTRDTFNLKDFISDNSEFLEFITVYNKVPGKSPERDSNAYV